MKDEDKQILRYLIKREIKHIKETTQEIVFPEFDIARSAEEYNHKLKEILEKLK
ncbi:hypothetical protein GOV14_02900 [Candidatus Pacearchaeota archaeon]|nr:hypothetical protein [Candidatus Pacearchaeota archaeon]